MLLLSRPVSRIKALSYHGPIKVEYLWLFSKVSHMRQISTFVLFWFIIIIVLDFGFASEFTVGGDDVASFTHVALE